MATANNDLYSKIVSDKPNIQIEPQGTFKYASFITKTKIGLALTCFFLTLLTSLVFEPPFLLGCEKDPIKQPKLSYWRTFLLSFIAAAMVLLIPLIR